MSLTLGRLKYRESIISICLMLVLFLIGLGVFVRQFDSDISRFGIRTGAVSSSQKSETKAAINLSAFLPEGFDELTEQESYDSDNLYEKINGKAPFYTEAGFKLLITQRFVSKDDNSLWMEVFVYDMGDLRSAFSVFSRQRRAGSASVSLSGNSQFAYQTGNGLYFVHGFYYVEINGSARSDKLSNAMVQVGQKMVKELNAGEDSRIEEFELFAAGAIDGSFKLHLINAFGFEKLTDTLSTGYNVDGEVLTAFLSQRADSENAKTIAEGYIDFLIENGAAVKKEINERCSGKVLDFYGTTEIVVAAGNFVVGIHEAENQQAAEKLLKILIDKLNKQ